jgi:GDP-L-fucose synthase
MEKDSKIYIAGHRGLVGSAILRRLQKTGHTNLLTRTREGLDLTDQRAVYGFFEKEKPAYVFLAAAKVGGIYANSRYPAEFIHQNLVIQTNIIHGAYMSRVKRLLFLGSSCIYPRLAPQPMKEEHLMTGPLEPTNSPYAVAKISGIEMCLAYNRQYGTCFLPVMPTNLYGKNDNFDLENSHVLPALIRKFHLAKLSGQGQYEKIEKDEKRFGKIPDDIKKSLGIMGKTKNPVVTLWGTGSALREFLHVDDLAEACVYLMENYHARDLGEFINIGTGEDIPVEDLAEMVKGIVGFEGEISWDTSKPDGTPRKLLDVSRIKALGWEPRIDLEEGIASTYDWYLRVVKGADSGITKQPASPDQPDRTN